MPAQAELGRVAICPRSPGRAAAGDAMRMGPGSFEFVWGEGSIVGHTKKRVDRRDVVGVHHWCGVGRDTRSAGGRRWEPPACVVNRQTTFLSQEGCAAPGALTRAFGCWNDDRRGYDVVRGKHLSDNTGVSASWQRSDQSRTNIGRGPRNQGVPAAPPQSYPCASASPG